MTLTPLRTFVSLSLTMAILAVPARQAAASGQGIHLMTASKAVHHLGKGGLKNLLQDNTYKRYFLSGAIFPDSTNPGGDIFHHSKFLDKYAIEVVKECRKGNSSTCKKLKSHFLGVLTHLRTDNRFDRYFVNKVADECHFADVGKSAQFWTDEHLDQIAVCQHWDFGKTFGLTFVENLKYPESTIIAATSAAGKSISKSKLSDAISKQEARLKEEFVLKKDQKYGILTFKTPDWCTKYLKGEKHPVTGAHAPSQCSEMDMKKGYSCKASYFEQCTWGSKTDKYYTDQSEKGSINDMGIDIIPGWIQTTYNQLGKAISSKNDGDIPTFSEKGSGMNRDLCRNWIASSAKYCK